MHVSFSSAFRVGNQIIVQATAFDTMKWPAVKLIFVQISFASGKPRGCSSHFKDGALFLDAFSCRPNSAPAQ
jgi:hypothetical protein